MAPLFIHSRRGQVFYQTSTGGAVQLFGVSEATYHREVEAADISAIGTGLTSRTYISGLRDGEVTTSGMFSSTTAKKLFGLLGYEPGGTVTFYPDGSASGKRYYQTAAVLTQVEIAAPVDDKVSMNTTWKLNGPTTIDVV